MDFNDDSFTRLVGGAVKLACPFADEVTTYSGTGFVTLDSGQVFRFEVREVTPEDAAGESAAWPEDSEAPPGNSGPALDDDLRTPWQADRDKAERAGKWPESWGPFHRHFASDAVHRDGGPECDQPGTPRRVYLFDPDYLREHEIAVARYAIAHPEEFMPEGGTDAT